MLAPCVHCVAPVQQFERFVSAQRMLGKFQPGNVLQSPPCDAAAALKGSRQHDALNHLFSSRQSSFTNMEDVNTVMSWFSSPVYSRYWQHYERAMGWYQRHRRAYHKALEAAYGRGLYPRHCPSSQARYTDWEAGEGHDEEKEEDEEDEEESSSDSDIECDVSNMEISEELRQYFAQTERHRRELKLQQQMEEQQQDYVPADQDLHGSSYRSTVAPPNERPGERRAAEMKKLYGENASKIMAMEAAMQLTFDRNRDLKQPKYWPVIPLKL